MTTATTFISNELESYLESLSADKKHSLQEIFASGSRFGKQEMQISWLQARFLKLILQISQAKKVLEIGTFVGFSASVIADALPIDGSVTTCEINTDHFNQALNNFEKFNLTQKIIPLLGDAKNTILAKQINSTIYDVIFLDGDKENYSFYFENLKNNLKKGGLFIVDNILFKGEVIQNEMSNYARGIVELNNLFKNSDEFFVSHVTLGDGMLLAYKK